MSMDKSKQTLEQMGKSTSVQASAIGILGGTFDPIHYGHINSAVQTANWLQLSQIVLMPCHIPPHKNSPSAMAEQRSEMVNIVCKDHPLFTLDDRELKRSTPSYTIDTLKELKANNEDTVIYFFIGMDSLLNFTTWHQWREILTLCHLVVSARPGYDLTRLNQTTQKLLADHQAIDNTVARHCSAGKVLFSSNDLLDISSTNIRRNIKEKKSCKNMTPKAILDFINKYQLYR